jgi:hypothetical protein
MGVPYSWGGGTPSGPSTGVDSGANIVGYDCSGFHPVRVRRRRRADSQVLGGSVQHRPQKYRSRRPNAVTCCSGVRWQPARRDLSGRRQDA